MPHKRKPGAAIPDTAAPETAHRIVVLIGTGRSGTSLCAKILKSLGLRLSDTLRRPNEMSLEGYFEDQILVDANRQLIEQFSPAAPHVPPRIPREAEAVAKVQVEAQERQIAKTAAAEQLQASPAAAEAEAELVRLREEHEIPVDRARQHLGAFSQHEKENARLKRQSGQSGARPAAAAAGGNAAGVAEAAAAASSEALRKARQNDAQLHQRIAELEKTAAREGAKRRAAETIIAALENLLRHRAGTALVEAVRRPGWRIVTPPWHSGFAR